MDKINILDWLYEYWVPIKGYEGFYEVSNWGRIKSYVKQKEGDILKPRLDGGGYQYVTFKKKNYKIHRIVLNAFSPNINNLPQINHKDENPLNNNIWNLEWCTALYNNHYGNRIKKQSESMKGHKDTEETRRKKSINHLGAKNAKSKATLQYTKEGLLIKEWESANQVQRELGYNPANITNCCNNKPGYRSAYGYVWKYK